MTHSLGHVCSSLIAAEGDSQSQIGEAYCMAGTAAAAYEIDIDVRYTVLYTQCTITVIYRVSWVMYACML